MECITGENLSIVWGKAFLKAMEGGNPPSIAVTITGVSNEEILEDERIREALDDRLLALDKQLIRTVANTIFPVSLWARVSTREQLFDRYQKILPRIKEDWQSRKGTYFERLISYNRTATGNGNQLDRIIEDWQSNVRRRSAFQAWLFDPAKDYSQSPYQGFPCLNQISFTPKGSNGEDGLVVSGFYPTQLMFEKAYGNYVGLARVGQFMAQEMDLILAKVQCVTTHAVYGQPAKRDLEPIKTAVETIVGELA